MSFSKFNNLKIRTQLILLCTPIFLLILYTVSTVLINEYRHLLGKLLYFAKIALLSVGTATIITPGMKYFAKKFGIFDKNNKEGVKANSVPLLGGAAVFFSVLLVLSLFQPWTKELKTILLAGSLIFIIGTIDDIRRLSSSVRLLGQVIAVTILFSGGLTISFFSPLLSGKVLAYFFTLLWVIGITNAMNFLDGADGLASGIAAISSFFFFLIPLHLGQNKVCFLAIVVAGCCVGFLFHNFKPAKIYLGDGGSTFLGFMLASIALYGKWSAKGYAVALGVPLLILGVLVFDMIYITISRVKNNQVHSLREWLDYTGHDHFHHRLMNLGFKEEHAVMFIYIINFILGISALALEKSQLPYVVVILSFQAGLFFISIIMLMLVGRQAK